MWPRVRTRYINVFRLDKHQTKKQVRLCKKKICITQIGTFANIQLGQTPICWMPQWMVGLTLIWRISAPLVKKDHYQRTCQGNQEYESTTEKLDWHNYNSMHQFKTGIETATFEKHAHTWTWDFKWEKNIKFCVEKNVVSLKKKNALKILGNRLHNTNYNNNSDIPFVTFSKF